MKSLQTTSKTLRTIIIRAFYAADMNRGHTGHDRDSTPSIASKVFLWVIPLMVTLLFFSFFWTNVGIGSLVMTAIDGDLEDDPTLDQYDAIESIMLHEQDTTTEIHIVTESSPTFASAGTSGQHEATSIQLTRRDGVVNEEYEVKTGITKYQFNATDAPDGEYTLTLVHYQPPNPGLFGTSEREYEQTTEFTIENGEITTVDPPWAARYD